MFEGFTMRYVLMMALIFLLCSCTRQISFFEVENRLDKSIKKVAFRSDGDVVYLGTIKPKQKKKIKVTSFSERKNLLTYEIDGQKKNITLCYQGIYTSAQGIVYIERNGPRLICG
jgi:hypothetical protein